MPAPEMLAETAAVADELRDEEVQTPATARDLAAREAQRLRDAAGAPEYERRELLADLGTRLEALAGDLGGSPDAAAIRALVAELHEDRLSGLSGDALTELWDRVLELLDRLAGATDGPGAGGPGSTNARTPFWKRR